MKIRTSNATKFNGRQDLYLARALGHPLSVILVGKYSAIVLEGYSTPGDGWKHISQLSSTFFEPLLPHSEVILTQE